MANILVVSLETSGAYTNTINLVKSFGHTVIGVIESELPNINLSSYDLIMTTRTESNSNTSKKLEEAILVHKIPVLCGSTRSGAVGSESVVTHMRLITSITEEGSTHNSNFIVNDGDVLKNFLPGYSFLTHTSDSYMYAAEGYVSEGQVITRMSTNNNISTLYFPVGTRTFNNVILPTKVMFCGFLYFQNSSYSSEVVSFFKDIIDFMLEPSLQVSGFVRDSSKKGIVRTLYAYEEETGRYVGTTVSLEDGSYTLDVSTDQKVFVVCLPLITTHNAQVHTNIIPIAIESTTDVNE